MRRVFTLIGVLAFVLGTSGAGAQAPAAAGDDVWTIDTSHSAAQFATQFMTVFAT